MVDYELIRSKRKTVSLEVNRELKIIVRAPMKMKTKDIDAFVSSHEKWLQKAFERQTERSERENLHSPQELEQMKKQAKAVIMPKVEYFSNIMKLYPTGITVTTAKTRFGSCSGKNSLAFSCRLLDYPDEAIDYVVVHELAHIAQHNHSREFYSVVESVMPDYKERQKMLKK